MTQKSYYFVAEKIDLIRGQTKPQKNVPMPKNVSALP
jgi:hypothetical protein